MIGIPSGIPAHAAYRRALLSSWVFISCREKTSPEIAEHLNIIANRYYYFQSSKWLAFK
jgi:hypothetical protein